MVGLAGFTEPFCCALETQQRKQQPTQRDLDFLALAIKNFKQISIEEASPHLDKFLQAILLEELWAKRKIEDDDVHAYISHLLWKFLPMNDDLRENRFFYLEITDDYALKHGLDLPNTRGLWKRKGDACLITGGLFGDYVRAERPPSNRFYPTAELTRKSGITAYHQAQALFSRFRNAEEQNLAKICQSIRDNYETLEDALYSIGKTHFFPPPNEEKTADSPIVTPRERRIIASYNLDNPLPPTIGELFKRSKLMTLYRRIRNKGYYD